MAEVNFLVKKGLTVPKGSASTPSVIFDASDPNTGLYSPGADQVAVATNGTGRLFVDSSGRILVGTSSARSNFFNTIISSALDVEVSTDALIEFSGIRNRNNADGAVIALAKSRGTTAGSNTIVTSGDGLGRVSFQGSDGSEFVEAAVIQAEVDGTPGANDMPGRLVFSTTVDGASSPTERLRITSAGLVGIGTTSPQLTIGAVSGTVLHLAGAGTTGVRVQNTSGNSVDIYAGTDGFINQSGSGVLNFQLAGSTKATLTSTGLGIGTASPSDTSGFGGTLDINGTTGAACYVRTNGSATDYGLIGHYGADFYVNNNSNGPIRFFANGDERARIDSSGRLLVGTAAARSSGALGTGLHQVESATYAISQLFSNGTGADGSYIGLWKSRGGTVGSTTIVQSGDIVGGIYFGGADGTNLVTNAAITSVVDGTPGASDMPGRLVFSTTPTGASTPLEALRIRSDQTACFIGDTGTAGVGVRSVIQATTLRGIVSGEYVFQGGHSGSAGSVGTVTSQIGTDGNVQNTNNSYGAISDAKLKENIVDASLQWDDLKAIQVRNYNFKKETGYSTHTQIGLIAQEVELVSPGLVSESPDRDEDGNDLGTVTKSVNYSVLYMKAVKALQEAMERIEQLETEMAEVKAQLS